MTTIAVTDDVKEMLLRVASELQLKFGRKVDLNDAIRYLATNKGRKPELLEIVTKPVHGFDEAYKELIEERRRDERRANRKYRV